MMKLQFPENNLVGNYVKAGRTSDEIKQLINGAWPDAWDTPTPAPIEQLTTEELYHHWLQCLNQ